MESLVVVAARMRDSAGQDRAPFSTTAIVRACFPDAAVTGRELPDGIQEIVTRTNEGPLIVYRRGISAADQRFAIAHALAHLLFDSDDDSAAIGRVGTPRCEERADRFAAELLVPLDHLARFVGQWPGRGVNREIYLDHVDHIAARFNAPTRVIDMRIRKLEHTAKLYG